MPYDWNDHWIPSAADNKSDVIGMGHIGGIGQLIYHTFTFKQYEYEISGSGVPCLKPVVSEEDSKPVTFNDFDSGKELFCDLYNLGKQINSLSDNNPIVELIGSFCTYTAHPYFIDEIYSLIKEGAISSPADLEQFERDYMFSIETFLDDLGRFYTAAQYYFAIQDIVNGTGEVAYNLCKNEGRLFSPLPFFERYKHAESLNDHSWPDDDYIAPDDLLAEMLADNTAADTTAGNDDWFAREPIDYYDDLIRLLCDIMPDFRLRLKPDPAKDKLIFAADVHSVFDIAWYVLAHLVAEIDPPTEPGELSVMAEGTLITCMNCGDAFIRRNNRQLYCLKEECRNAHNAKRQQQYRDRKKRQNKADDPPRA